MRVRERFGRPFLVAVGQLWARSGPVSGVGGTGAWGRLSGAAIRGPWSRRPVSPQVAGISPDLGGGFWSSCVPLSPAVPRTHDGRNSWRPRGFLWASGGPAAGAEGLLDALAGDLVTAGYAVGVGGEQDMHTVPGAGRDFGGWGAGGQPQRQRGMAKVVRGGAPARCVPGPDGRGTGLVPNPAIRAFAERPAAGTLEQPPIIGAPESRTCQRRRRASCGGTGTVLMAPSGRCLRPRDSREVPLPVQARADRGRDPVRSAFHATAASPRGTGDC